MLSKQPYKSGHYGRDAGAVASSAGSIRVFLIHPYLTTLWALSKLVESSDELALAGSARNSEEALPAVQQAAPDVILFFVIRAQYAMLDEIPELASRSNAKVIVLSGTRDPVLQDKAVLSGARGLTEMDGPPDLIVRAIRKVHEGELWIDRAAANRILVECMRQRGVRAADSEQKKIATLTGREREVIAVAVTNPGATAKNIAGVLNISEHTARNHINSVYEKLHVTNRVELFEYARKHRLSALPEN